MDENKELEYELHDGDQVGALRDEYILFAAVIFVVSATTSGAFFYTFLPDLIPPEWFGREIGRIIGALIGVFIYDVLSLLWLRQWLRGAQNDDQRKIAMWSSVLDIAGSAAASFAQLLLTGTGLINMPQEAKNTIGIVTLVLTAFVITWNFIAVWRFHKNSNESKVRIRTARRIATIARSEERQLDALDKEIARQVDSMMGGFVPVLAKQKATELVLRRLNEERGRGGLISRDLIEALKKKGFSFDEATVRNLIDEGDGYVVEPSPPPSPPANDERDPAKIAGGTAEFLALLRALVAGGEHNNGNGKKEPSKKA